MTSDVGSVLWSLPVDISATLTSMLLVQLGLSTVLFVLFGLAFARRRSLPYLLVWIGVSTLLLEGLFGVAGLLVSFNPWLHILLDYVLDTILVGTFIGAIYYARRHTVTEQSPERLQQP